MRYAAFLAPVFLVVTPVYLFLKFFVGPVSDAAFLVLGLVYGTLCFRGLLALSWRRSVLGAVVGDTVALVVFSLYMILGAIVANLLAASVGPP